MWRFVVAAILVLIAAKVGDYFGSLMNDETGGEYLAIILALATVPWLWPVYFGLRDPSDE